MSIGEGQYLAFGQGSSSGSPENPEAYKFSSNLKTLPSCDKIPTNSQNLCAKPLAASGGFYGPGPLCGARRHRFPNALDDAQRDRLFGDAGNQADEQGRARLGPEILKLQVAEVEADNVDLDE